MYKKIASAMMAFTLLCGSVQADQRLITIGPTATSIVQAIGESQKIVAVDTESHSIFNLHKLPNIGYMRTLSLTSLLSVKPTTVINVSDAAPLSALDRLTQFGVQHVGLEEVVSPNDVYQNIQLISQRLDAKIKGETLIKKIKSEVKTAQKNIGSVKPKILVLLQISPSGVYILGQQTNASVWLNLLHAKNSVAFKGMRPLSHEGLLTYRPNIILLATTQKNMPNAFQQEITYLRKHKGVKLISINANMLDSFGADFGCNYQYLVNRIYPHAS